MKQKSSGIASLRKAGIGSKRRNFPPTFEQAGTEWLRKRAVLRANPRETYQHALKHLNAFFGERLVCDIEAPDVAAYQKARAAENAAGATANKEFTVLASVLADHGLWTAIRRDAKRLEENESAGRALLPDEESRLLRVASDVGVKQGHWSPIYTVTVLGLNTGCDIPRSADCVGRMLIWGSGYWW